MAALYNLSVKRLFPLPPIKKDSAEEPKFTPAKTEQKVNWFPGHMKKALDELEKLIKTVDVVIYVLDARCPKSCLNPAFQDIVNRKKVIYYYAKRDLASANLPNVDVIAEIAKLFPDKIGFIKAMVIGVPNVGKSTLINKMAHRKKAMTGNKPGVTKQPQWVEVTRCIYLLDTPGILMPNIENPRVAKNLAYIGTIKDDVLDIVELAEGLLKELKIANRPVENLRDAKAVLCDFREGKFGKYNLDNLK
jgi:ribosome biogenesis GTPase A